MKKIENILLNFGEIYETNDESMYSKGQKNITFEQGSWIQARISSNSLNFNPNQTHERSLKFSNLLR